MATEWYYARQGQQFGPVNDDQMTGIIDTQKLDQSDLVWCEGMEDWARVGDVFVLENRAAFSAGDGAAAKEPSYPPPRPAAAQVTYLDLHPLIVLLLTICSLGLFALWYLRQMLTTYARMVPPGQLDGSGRPLGQLRHPAWVMAMSCISLGTDCYYWSYVVLRECWAFSGRRTVSPRAELTFMTLFPPYLLYVLAVRIPAELARMQALVGLEPTLSPQQTIFLINPCFFVGFPYLCMWQQETLNDVWLRALSGRRKQT